MADTELIKVILIVAFLLLMIIIYRLIFGRIIIGQYSEKGLKWIEDDMIIFGRPDRVVKKGQSILIYEYKSRKAPVKPYSDHVLQLALYMVMFERTHNKRPDAGIVKYKDHEFRIDYTEDLKKMVFEKVKRYIDIYNNPVGMHRNHNNRGKCLKCKFSSSCKFRL